MPMRKWWAVGLVVLVVVETVSLVWLVRDQRDAGRAVDADTAEAVGAVVASADLKAEVLAAAAEAATTVFSYSQDSLAEDKAAARDLLTGEMVEQYDHSMAGMASADRANRSDVAASVVGTALISVRSHEAKVLVFVNQRTTGSEPTKSSLDLDRIVMTLERGSGEWRVSELDAL